MKEWVITQLPRYAEKHFLKAEHICLHANCMSPVHSLLKLWISKMKLIPLCFNRYVQNVFCVPGGENNTLTFLCSAEMRLKFSIASSQRGGKRQIWSSMLNGFCETINGSVRHNSWSNDSHSTSYSIINYFTLQRGDSSSSVLAFYEEPPTSPNSACPKLPSFWNELFCFMESRRAQIQFFMHVF